ncbi:hypothetical protein BCR33DRAFT_775871 [Rhizoclosmatium globosum]|uniref:Uncharacterized protein n=1 Tax=Rhizoclosmatium globosum TaxID=329046 RepID=A0A1Y2AIL6_9FUNG|nr:hypothetical protein BCR33DRAFT_775871 [Rhizoclosmatium globosum]|eukprot:ORY22334.1 hypothetical protein BCR33DRAFT_775871 [Rhizoclosmatium globosum]
MGRKNFTLSEKGPRKRMRLGKKQTKKRALANQTTPMASGRTTQKQFALGTAQMKHRSGHVIDLTGFDDDDDGDEDGADHGQRSPAKRLRTCQTTTGTTTTIDLTKDDDDDDDEIENNGAEAARISSSCPSGVIFIDEDEWESLPEPLSDEYWKAEETFFAELERRRTSQQLILVQNPPSVFPPTPSKPFLSSNLKKILRMKRKAGLREILLQLGDFSAAAKIVCLEQKVEAVVSKLEGCQFVVENGVVVFAFDVGIKNLGWVIVVRTGEGSIELLKSGCCAIVATTAGINALELDELVRETMESIIGQLPDKYAGIPRRFLVERQSLRPRYNPRLKRCLGPPMDSVRNSIVEHVLTSVLNGLFRRCVVNVDPCHVGSHWKRLHPDLMKNIVVRNRDSSEEYKQYIIKKGNAIKLVEELSQSRDITGMGDLVADARRNHHVCDAAIIAVAWLDWVDAALRFSL